MTTPSPAYTFQQILEEERKLLRELRRGGAPRPGQDGSPQDQDEFLGLSFSGGGIRSATFNLGVLQALSELRLLREFDYLSTVSGGGYIGSWLSAWIHRAGADTVQQQLSIKDHPDAEPKEVTFLRSYSNYLTPRTGIFSTDTLAAVATYLRNLILNLSIVLLCLTVVLLLPRLTAWAGRTLQAEPTALLAFTALALGVAVFMVNLNLASQLPYSRSNRGKKSLGLKWKAPPYATRTAVIAGIVLPLSLAALALSFWLAADATPRLLTALLTVDWPTLRRDLVVVGAITVAISLFWFSALRIAGVQREPGDRPTWRWRVSALVIGVLIGLVALVVFQEMLFALSAPEPMRLWRATVTGLPGLLGVFGLAVVFVIGVSGRQFEEDSREWWSRLGGVLFGVAVGWLIVAGLAIYSPPWVMRLTRLAQGLSVAWLVTTFAGVRAAMSGRTGKPGSMGWRDRLAMITPYVFLAGLLVALAFGIHAALAAWHGQDTSTSSEGDYFADIAELAQPEAASWCRSSSARSSPLFFSWRIDVNVFAFHMFYRNRLVRCYLGASNPRRANHPFTGFDGDDSVPMKNLAPAPLPSRQRRAEHHPRDPAGLAGAQGRLVRGEPALLRIRAAGRRSRWRRGATSAPRTTSPTRTSRGWPPDEGADGAARPGRSGPGRAQAGARVRAGRLRRGGEPEPGIPLLACGRVPDDGVQRAPGVVAPEPGPAPASGGTWARAGGSSTSSPSSWAWRTTPRSTCT